MIIRQILRDMPADPRNRRGCYALAVTQSADEFSVIDHLAPECALGDPLDATESLDIGEQSEMIVH